jgi:transposase-like protein
MRLRRCIGDRRQLRAIEHRRVDTRLQSQRTERVDRVFDDDVRRLEAVTLHLVREHAMAAAKGLHEVGEATIADRQLLEVDPLILGAHLRTEVRAEVERLRTRVAEDAEEPASLPKLIRIAHIPVFPCWNFNRRLKL